MVFLVDHQAYSFARHQGNASWTFRGGQLAANELSLDQKLSVQWGQSGNIDVFQPRLEIEFGDALAQHAFDLGFLVGAGAVAEWKGGQVASQADAAGDDDVGLWPGAAQPFAAGVCQAIQVHPGRSLCRRRSRKRAASSYRSSSTAVRNWLRSSISPWTDWRVGSRAGVFPTCRSAR